MQLWGDMNSPCLIAIIVIGHLNNIDVNVGVYLDFVVQLIHWNYVLYCMANIIYMVWFKETGCCNKTPAPLFQGVHLFKQ